MHGKKRAEYKAQAQNPKIAAALEAKAEQWYTLMKELRHRRDNSNNAATTDSETMDDNFNESTSAATTTLSMTLKLLEKALLVNPDPLNLWNHRREVLLTMMSNDDNNDPSENNKIHSDKYDKISVLETERGLTQAALQRNPKSYGAWFHRKWILQTIKPVVVEAFLKEELALTTLFLSLDERNFHCWNYRRFVVACMAGNWNGDWNVPIHNNATTKTTTKTTTATATSTNKLMGPQVLPLKGTGWDSSIILPETFTHTIPQELLRSEFEFTANKIKDNFSNFSAFHYRSQLVDFVVLSDDDNDGQEDCLLQEFQLIEDAICTEPDDQTAWWYHAILLDKLDGNLSPSVKMKVGEQADLFRELLEDSPDGGKWISLGLLRVLPLLDSETGDDSILEQQALLRRLMTIDPDRMGRYQTMMTQLEKKVE
ncbi:protein prenyltransferase alpha subunit repeat-containing protein [Nitzschia inconspicua]|uniref:Geranylgeranyl transferase type-2 subunit alpha n=1 Tax=Nitzschia inconspicua TaxID=303405 RepID=A0A9K3L990_9STRA|nr:protein prenyltransferase alpha subunit repeat-containing protein [Nitzschia inconspicua]